MPIIDSLLMELEQEQQSTRKLFERTPEDKLGWKPHPKSYSLGQLAMHIAQLPAQLAMMAAQDVFQFTPFQQPEARSRAELLRTSEEALAAARKTLSQMDDKRLMAAWTAQQNGQTLITMPRIALLRTFLLNHFYHHRGQLSVYLRLLDVPLPSIYGPSADENPFV